MSLILGIKNTDVKKALQDLADSLPKEAGYTRVGVLEEATYYEDGTPVALVAGVQEFGSTTNNIPPRPFFRSTMAQQARAWSESVQAHLKAGTRPDDILRLLGKGAADDVKRQIIAITAPPLKPATIKRKGFDKPLEETAHLQKSITSDVKKGAAGE